MVSVDDFDGESEFSFDPFDKNGTVGSISECGGGDTECFVCLILFNRVQKRLKCQKGAFDADRLKVAAFFVRTFTDAHFGFLFADKMKPVTACLFKDNQSGGVRTDIDDCGSFGHKRVTLLPGVFRI